MRQAVVALFILTAGAVLVQDLLRRNVVEPFPALLMPSFAASPSDGETYTVTRAILEATDDSRRVRRALGTDLTKDAGVLPNSVLRLIAFEEVDVAGRPGPFAPRSPVVRRLAGQHVGRTRNDAEAVIDQVEVTAWLRERTTEIFARQDVRGARLAWHELKVDRNTEQIVSDEVLKTVTLFPR